LVINIPLLTSHTLHSSGPPGYSFSANLLTLRECHLEFGARRTTVNVCGDAATDEMTEAHSKVVGLALNGAQGELTH
jgi:hypothetical protein